MYSQVRWMCRQSDIPMPLSMSEREDVMYLYKYFCSKEEYDDIPFLAIFESKGQSSRRKNIIKAWEIQLDDFQLESISVKNIQCPDEF